MELPVPVQLRELGAALVLGAGLGIWYDLLRLLRRGRRSTAAADLLFSLSTLPALLLFALYAGRGRLRIFALLAMAGGWGAWLATGSRPFRRLEQGLIRLLTGPAGAIRKKMKKNLKKSKKTVANGEKTGKIENRQILCKLRRKEVSRVKLKKASLLTKLLILAVAVYAVVTLVSLQDRIAGVNAEVERLEEQVLYAEQEYAQVQQDLEELGSDQSVKKIARSRLGMVEAGEIVFHDADVQD